MKYFKQLVVGLFFVFTCQSCTAQKELVKLEVLIGTWKVESKETYESWSRLNEQELKGESYKNTNGEKRITETLSIRVVGTDIVYEATVKSQNNGSTIPFKLHKDTKELFSFENLTHDFPKKIQYKVIDANKLLVNVFGANDQGFSYYLIKQE